MEPRRPPEHTLEIFADPTAVKDVVRGTCLHPAQVLCHLSNPSVAGILHTIFFHRYFPTLRPSTIDILDLTLPYVSDPDLVSLIDTRAYQLTRQLSSPTAPNGSVRGQIGVQFFEKKRRKGGGGLGWFGGGGRGEEEVCWELWRLEVTLATPKTEAGTSPEVALICRALRRSIVALCILHERLADAVYRAEEGSQSDGDDATEDGAESSCHCQPAQGPHPAYYDERNKPLSISGNLKSESERVGETSGADLGRALRGT